jgi:hypothetical protein
MPRPLINASLPTSVNIRFLKLKIAGRIMRPAIFVFGVQRLLTLVLSLQSLETLKSPYKH